MISTQWTQGFDTYEADSQMTQSASWEKSSSGPNPTGGFAKNSVFYYKMSRTNHLGKK